MYSKLVLPCDTRGWTASRFTAQGERLSLVDGTNGAHGRGARVADIHLQKWAEESKLYKELQ